MSTYSTADDEKQPNNPQAPPSSAEEAAALLSASISFDNASFHAASSANPSANPPVGMHSIFTVQSPIPNGVLFVRLCNLREWLRWHHAACSDREEEDDETDAFFKAYGDDPLSQSLRIAFPKVDKNQKAEPFTAARSILAVLMKLLDVTTSAAFDNSSNSTTANSAANEFKSDSSFSPKKQINRPLPKQITKQHKPLPPLLSAPLRKTWADCVALCLSLGSASPGAARVDIYATLTKMTEAAGINPRSKLAGGGVRLAALDVIERIGSTLEGDTAKRLALHALEVLQCCHRGLLSGGAGEPGHRAACMRAACGWMVGCRRAWSSSNTGGGREGGDSFTAPGASEERAAIEAIKLVKRAASDKYPEVRMGAAVFGGIVAPMLVRNVAMFSGAMMRKDGGEGVSPLAWLEDLTQLAMRNLDDESAGVATAWAATLARCLCASAEYGKSVRDAQSEDQANKRSADVDDEEIAIDNNLDLAGKFKAFSESRRAAAATSVCSSAVDAVKFLVSNFVKCGGESTSNKCGGSFSIGGRACRLGYSAALTEFLRLQAAKGEFALADALHPVLDMVGASFDKQVHRLEKSGNVTLSDAHDLYAPSSPYLIPEKKATASISTAFLNKSPKGKCSADSTIGRLLTSMVMRKGISENMSELSQFSVLREITVACRMSVAATAPDGSTEPSTSINAEHGEVLNRHQIQVALVEMSHLIIGLGEAAAASLEEIMPVLKDCLAHRDHGVRLEAATVYTAVAQAFPSEGRKFVIESLSSFIPNMDAIQSLSLRVASETTSTPKGRFRRGGQDSDTAGSRLAEELMQHQCHMHGNALAVSMLMHEFPHVVGGIARVIVDKTFDVCEKLLQCQSNETFFNANPSAVCTCIRAGYCMLSGLFTMGVDAIVPHVSSIFTLWQNSSMNVLPGISKQSSSHDLLCVESILSSVVSFLKFCPTLLLSVPDALNRITSILEKIFPVVSSGGRFELEGSSSIGSARLSNARSAVMEAYSWLPPGSFPLSADRIFNFAAKQIQELSADGVICSILNSLVSREDDLVDAHSFERAVSPGQVGSSATLDNIISIRSYDIVTSYERETVVHLLAWKKTSTRRAKCHESLILGSLLRESDDNPKPTPLHEVGTWRQPLDPIPTAKVRLLDSSIHVFAATFGLQDPHTQSDALRMLESMYVSTQAEKSNRFNVNGALITDSQGRVKPLEDDAVSTNTIAVVLACLQAIPLHEATYGTVIGKGPPWMERATNLLLQLIPSPSDIIRRGAAEGLSYLATLGVSEDAHTLQSTILHALDEVMKGNNAAANPRTNLDVVSLGRAGALLTLACIQRTSKRMERSKIGRVRSVSHTPDSKESCKDAPPVIIMMTRLLPSLATHSPDLDSSIVRTHAIHSFGVLISNSFPKNSVSLSPEQIQIVWKAVEAIESSFLGGLSAVMLDYNKGREREKFAWEPALVAAIFRLMTTLIPWLSYLVDLDRWIASRFSCYASGILDCLHHPVVRFEGSVFFECLSAHRELVHPINCCVMRTNTAAVAMPFLLSAIQPSSASVVVERTEEFCNCESSIVKRSAVMCMSSICSKLEHPNDFPFNLRSSLFVFLHDLCGRRRYQHISDYRSLAQSHASLNHFDDLKSLEADVVSLIHLSLNVQAKVGEATVKSFLLLQWLLCCRYIVSGGTSKRDQQNYSESVAPPIERLVQRFQTVAQLEASRALNSSNPPRWQIKCVAANVASVALDMLIDLDRGPTDVSIFNVRWAKSQFTDNLKQKHESTLPPLPAFYLEELVLTACSASASTSNHSELLSVQIAGIRLLTSLFGAFSDKKDSTTNDDTSVLDQFSSQIISAVKHSLKSELQPEESAVSGFHLIFSAGCDALLVMIKTGFISDPIALKRMLKPIMLSERDALFVEFPSEENAVSSSLVTLPHCVTDDLRSYPLFRLSKLLFAARISMLSAFEEIDQSAAATIAKEFEKDEEGRAIHSAAAAIDGFLLMTGGENGSGLTFKNRVDLDGAIATILVENWSTLCASAFASLMKLIKSTDEHSDKRKLLQEWLEKLSTIAFSGLKVALSRSSATKRRAGRHACSCIYAVRLFIRENAHIGRSILNPSELSNVIAMVTQSVISPSLGIHESSSYVEDSSLHLLKQSCGLFEDICLHNSELGIPYATLLRSVICPLVSFQEGKYTLDGANDATVSSCIRSSISLMRSSCENDRASLEKALVQFVMLTLIKLKSIEQSTSTEAECLSLLRACLENTILSQDEWTEMALFAASNDLWDAWSVIASALPAGVGIECSMYLLKKSLGNLKASCIQQAKALAAFRNGLQSAVSQTPTLVGTTLQLVGYEVFQLFRFHGVNMCCESKASEGRLLVCAECVKLIMMAFQYLTSVAVEETKFVRFLVSLFSLLVESVSYNGMPNHPSGKRGADEKIGKLCAHVFVHIARTTPPMFKYTMTVVVPECRSTIEMAVRADMSGYAATSTGPVKKKLNLKGFVR